MKRITATEQVCYSKLIVAHARMDKKEVVRISFEEQGVVTKYMDPEACYLLSSFYNDRDTGDVMQGKNVSDFLDWLEAKDPMIRVPDEYIIACRVNLLLRGMGSAFGLRFRMSPMWLPYAEECLKRHGVEY